MGHVQSRGQAGSQPVTHQATEAQNQSGSAGGPLVGISHVRYNMDLNRPHGQAGRGPVADQGAAGVPGFSHVRFNMDLSPC